MAKLPPTSSFPWKPDHVISEKKEDLRYFLKMLIKKLISNYSDIANVVNINAVEFKDQNAQPTPNKGQMCVWKDANASSSSATHYIVYTDDNGSTVTFPSNEVA